MFISRLSDVFFFHPNIRNGHRGVPEKLFCSEFDADHFPVQKFPGWGSSQVISQNSVLVFVFVFVAAKWSWWWVPCRPTAKMVACPWLLCNLWCPRVGASLVGGGLKQSTTMGQQWQGLKFNVVGWSFPTWRRPLGWGGVPEGCTCNKIVFWALLLPGEVSHGFPANQNSPSRTHFESSLWLFHNAQETSGLLKWVGGGAADAWKSSWFWKGTLPVQYSWLIGSGQIVRLTSLQPLTTEVCGGAKDFEK